MMMFDGDYLKKLEIFYDSCTNPTHLSCMLLYNLVKVREKERESTKQQKQFFFLFVSNRPPCTDV